MKLQLPYALERTVVKVISFSCIRFELYTLYRIAFRVHTNNSKGTEMQQVVNTHLGGSCFQNLSPPFVAAGMPDFVCV